MCAGRGSSSESGSDGDDHGDSDEDEGGGLATKLKVITSFFQLSSTVVGQYKVVFPPSPLSDSRVELPVGHGYKSRSS